MRPKNRRSITKCVHCLAKLNRPTRDHVFPSSWYPDNTPRDVQRWTVPSCARCNGTFGRLEKELFIGLALCVGPLKAEASGISASALRSLGVGIQNLDSKERAHRTALLRKLATKIRPLKDLGAVPLVPGLGPHAGFPIDEQMAITVSDELLQRVSGKVLRGCEYKLNKNAYIEEPYQLKVYFAHDAAIPDVTAFIEKKCGVTTLGPGFEVRRGESPPEEAAHIVFYRVTIWGTLKIYATIARDEQRDRHSV